MQILEDDDLRLSSTWSLDQFFHDREQLSLPSLRIDVAPDLRGVGNAEEVEDQRQGAIELRVDQEESAGNLAPGFFRGVVLSDTEVAAQQLQSREKRDHAAVRDCVGLANHHPARPATFGELVAESALADAGLGDDANHARIAGGSTGQRRLQLLHLRHPPHEPREAAQAGGVEACAERTDAFELIDAYRLGNALHLQQAEITKAKEAAGQLGNIFGHVDAPGLGDLLHARGETHRLSLRGIVHPQVVTDGGDHDFAGVETHPHCEVELLSQTQLVRVAAQRAGEVQRGVTGALRVVLVGDRCPEQGHDAVAGELVDRPFEAMDALAQDGKELIEDAMPPFRVDPPGELHRLLDVGKQNRDLLAFAVQSGARREDFLGQVSRRVGAEIGGRAAGQVFPTRRPRAGHGAAAFEAKVCSFGQRRPAARAYDRHGRHSSIGADDVSTRRPGRPAHPGPTASRPWIAEWRGGSLPSASSEGNRGYPR